MAIGEIPTEFQLHPLTVPSAKLPLIYAKEGPLQGLLTGPSLQTLTQMIAFVTSTNRIIPVSVRGTNDLTLTLSPGGPQIGLFGTNTSGYYDYDVFSGVAAETSTGPVTAHVVTPVRPNVGEFALDTLKVYKTNGSAQAGAGDLTQGLHYTFTFVDLLDGGNGGLVLR